MTLKLAVEALRKAVIEIDEASDKMFVLGLNHPGGSDPTHLSGNNRMLAEDKAFMAALSDRFSKAAKQSRGAIAALEAEIAAAVDYETLLAGPFPKPGALEAEIAEPQPQSTREKAEKIVRDWYEIGDDNKLAKVIEAITAVLVANTAAPQRGVRWQPISTAPKDGTRILVVGGKYTEPVIVMADIGWWLYANDKFGLTSLPTHWQPLPSPPEGGGK